MVVMGALTRRRWSRRGRRLASPSAPGRRPCSDHLRRVAELTAAICAGSPTLQRPSAPGHRDDGRGGGV